MRLGKVIQLSDFGGIVHPIWRGVSRQTKESLEYSLFWSTMDITNGLDTLTQILRGELR